MPSWKKVITSGSDASLNSLVVSDTFQVNGVEYRTYEKTGIAIGINTLITFNPADGYAAHLDYLVRNSVDSLRAGKIVLVWDGSAVRITDTSTVDIGNTHGIAFDATIDQNGSVDLELAADSTGWVFKSDCKIL